MSRDDCVFAKRRTLMHVISVAPRGIWEADGDASLNKKTDRHLSLVVCDQHQVSDGLEKITPSFFFPRNVTQMLFSLIHPDSSVQ